MSFKTRETEGPNPSPKKILLWGGKSQSRILQQMLKVDGNDVSFIFDKNISKPTFETDAVFSNDPADIDLFIEASTHFIVGIGGQHGMARYLISERLKSRGLIPLTLVSQELWVDDTSTIGWGFQAMPRVVVHSFSTIGNACILNSSATIDHESSIGNGVHIMGSAAIAGRVVVEDYATIGTNATVRPDLTIGRGAFIGAGAVVTKDVGENNVVVGNPALYVRKNEHHYDLSGM